MEEYLVRWGSGSLRLKAGESSLSVDAANASILLESRMLRINGSVGSWADAALGRDRWVYVDFREEFKPIPTRRGATSRVLLKGLYDARSIDVGFEKYLTIVVPGFFLYDYVIISSWRMAVKSPAKRSFYFDHTDASLTIYIV